ncbi:hypothetical protein BD289DRAFT_469509 [Coniella lustricola]|uniref:Uncharacterized protein n=1 Tax=Coniella lustricola TaxID=2025994 RepID=A0A2T2ZWP3_9PEZI|nr:hypothetical protein BD289DRAFT_469509 [Coniella lustricola]
MDDECTVTALIEFGPRRRFAPVPVETTFKEHRRPAGPAAELTPEPSPTEEAPPAVLPCPPAAPMVVDHETQTVVRGKRRFAPQLLESTRRSRRAGDTVPATRHADKTDITPYSKHIYSLSSKKKQQQQHRRPGHARRESCDDEIAEHVFDLNKLEAQKRMMELAMSAFPNSTVRLGGAEHFFVREGSDDDSSTTSSNIINNNNNNTTSSRGRAKAKAAKKDERRDSSIDNVNWMVKEMQKHADQLAADRGDVVGESDSWDSGSVRSEGPPDNTFDFTNKARHTIRNSLGSLSTIGEDARAAGQSAAASYLGSPGASYDARASAQPTTSGTSGQGTFGEDSSPDVEMHGTTSRALGGGGGGATTTAAAASHQPQPPQYQQDTSSYTRPRGAFGRFYGYGNQAGGHDKAAEKALFRLRTQKSPPMAGSDLTFRICPSPKQTKLESDQKWDVAAGAHVELNRDTTGENGLWRGYCFTNQQGDEALAPSQRPAPMIMTPMFPATPFEHSDPYAATDGTLAPFPISAEPSPVASSSGQSFSSEHRARGGQPKGLHMLMGLEQRLQQEKVAAEFQERIAAEFDDQFVTQVYNYLSLGYPATARAFDEELSKISRIPTEELQTEDDVVMDGIGSRAKGHIKISMDLDDTASEDKRCPRWKALKQYIFEWARQHPDLDSITPLAWGVAERRGSWGI